MALFSWLVSSKFSDYALTSVTVGVIAILSGLYALQTKLIYVPDFPPGSRKDVWRPSRFGFHKFDEVTLVTSDGIRLHAYWIPSTRKTSKSVPTILFFHANAGNMGHRLPILRRLNDFADANFFIISYRGYGESEGRAEEAGLKRDAQAALEYLLEERMEEIDINKIVLYGQSIGGAVTIDLAARNQSKIAGFIVENTFLSLPRLIPHVMPMLGWARLLCHQRWESEERLREMLGSPKLPKMLFLSGSRDELVPPSHVQSLYEIVTGSGHEEAKSKTVIHYFDKGTHNDTFLQPGYFEAVAAFLNSL